MSQPVTAAMEAAFAAECAAADATEAYRPTEVATFRCDSIRAVDQINNLASSVALLHAYVLADSDDDEEYTNLLAHASQAHAELAAVFARTPLVKQLYGAAVEALLDQLPEAGF